MPEIVSQIITRIVGAWRRRGYAIGVAWAMALAGWFAVSMMPDKYSAQAVVHIDTSSILAPLLRGMTVQNERGEEVKLLEKSLISRPNIEQVAREAGIEEKAGTQAELEVALQGLQSRIVLQRQRAGLFSIGYEDLEPQVAHDVVASLLAILVKGTTKKKKNNTQLDTARRFIEDQIAVYEKKLSDLEVQIAEFYQKNPNHLPGRGKLRNTFLGAQKRLAALQAELTEAELKRRTLVTEMNAVPKFFAPSAFGGGGPPTNTAIYILEAQKQLDDLMSRYTDLHPDVVIAKRRLQTLFELQQKELDSAEFSDPFAPGELREITAEEGGISNPIYEKIKIQVVEQEVIVAALRNRIVLARSEYEKLETLVVRSPVIESQIARLNRDYEIQKKNFDRLLASRETEIISRARDDQVEPVRIRVIEPPFVPTIPSSPNRLLFISMVLGVSLISGIGVSVLVSMTNESFSSVAELKSTLHLPVLGTVSTAGGMGRGHTNYGATISFWLSAMALIGAFSALWFLEQNLGLNELLMGELTQMPEDWLKWLPAF